MAIEEFAAKMMTKTKEALGVREITAFVEIDKQKRGFLTSELHIQYEEYQGQDFLRLRTVSYAGSGSNGRRNKAFAWPIDADEPKGFVAMLERVIAAADSGTDKVDSRGAITRFFDRVTGLSHINEINPLDEHHIGKDASLIAEIREDKDGRYVILTEKRKGRSSLWLLIPLKSVEALITFLES